MYESLQTLTDREIEVLRLLVGGHDIKSTAHALDLSVHTVNDRLRDARRKLGVSSSREAARLVAEMDSQDPNFFGHRKIGTPKSSAHSKNGVATPGRFLQFRRRGHRESVGRSIAWLAGGMLVMSLVIAAFVLSTMQGSGSVQQPESPPAMTVAGIDLMSFADTNGDGKVTREEYRVFSEQGWEVVSAEQAEVRLAELDSLAQMAFVGIQPNAEGIITRQMYIDAIPQRFQMFDQDGDGVLSADELHGRNFQGRPAAVITETP